MYKIELFFKIQVISLPVEDKFNIHMLTDLNLIIRFMVAESTSRYYYNLVLSELKKKLYFIENKRKVLFSLLINTHCAGCGRHNYVCFWGYCGEYCSKRCWIDFHDEYNSDYDEEDSLRLWWIYDKYKFLDSVNLKSNARNWRKKSKHKGTVIGNGFVKNI